MPGYQVAPFRAWPGTQDLSVHFVLVDGLDL